MLQQALHIDDFCRDCVRIMVLLHKRFPQKSTLYIEDIIGPDEPDEFGLHSPRHLACLGAALWLADEGYLRFGQTMQQQALDEAVLTHKAFLLLSAAAPSLDLRRGGEQTRAFVFEDLLREASSETLSRACLDFLAADTGISFAVK